MADPTLVELRGEIPREYIDVIDAVVQANPGSNRMTIVRQILGDWVEHKVHESSMVLAIRRAANGRESESTRNVRTTPTP